MKKLNILFTLFIVFFVGTIGANAALTNNQGTSKLESTTNTPDDVTETCSYNFNYSNKEYRYVLRGMCGNSNSEVALYDENNKYLGLVDKKNIRFDITDYCTVCGNVYVEPNGTNPLNFVLYNNEAKKADRCYINTSTSEYKFTSDTPTEDGWIIIEYISTQEECREYYNGRVKNGSNGGSKITAEIVSCGNGMLKNIPYRITKIISTIITVIQVGVPVLLIIFGMLDFAKGIVAQKEDEITKGRKTFITRLITAILVFFVIFIVKVAVRFVADTDSANIINCVNCFISADCDI